MPKKPEPGLVVPRARLVKACAMYLAQYEMDAQDLDAAASMLATLTGVQPYMLDLLARDASSQEHIAQRAEALATALITAAS